MAPECVCTLCADGYGGDGDVVRKDEYCCVCVLVVGEGAVRAVDDGKTEIGCVGEDARGWV